MSQFETEGAEPPRRTRRRHAPKRRGPGPLWMIGSAAIVVIGVLAAVTSLDSGPVRRPGPAVDGGQPGMPALIQQDHGDGGEGSGQDDGQGDAAGAVISPSATATATPSGTATASPSAPATAKGGTTASPSAPAPSSTTGRPGRSGSAPGNKKKQR
ncbi:hypothetical protein ACIRSU_25025 [Streptomyces sp. NPDC101160]|uniref:hypothetical protein n=1 Tax=Streptomyces sp. NPDC101160 TaxID=3366118 RepID=UPI003808F61F